MLGGNRSSSTPPLAAVRRCSTVVLRQQSEYRDGYARDSLREEWQRAHRLSDRWQQRPRHGVGSRFVNHLEGWWELPPAAHFLGRLDPQLCNLASKRVTGRLCWSRYSRSSSFSRTNNHITPNIKTKPPTKPTAAPHNPAVVPPVIPPTVAPTTVNISGRRQPIICMTDHHSRGSLFAGPE